MINGFTDYKRSLSVIKSGKSLGDALYIHIETLQATSSELHTFVTDTQRKCCPDFTFNVVKFFKQSFQISLLSYPDFFIDPHPQLISSYSINLTTGKARSFSYSNSQNPPILHKKELLLLRCHPQFEKFKKLTEEETQFGLYRNSKTIGFKQNWEKIVESQGLSYVDHRIVRLDKGTEEQIDLKVERHKTAITRYSFSKPIQTILEHNLLTKDDTFFDYGCGLGDDIRGLSAMDYNVSGWDPVHMPNASKTTSDIVNLGYVLNVIEDPAERVETLLNAYALSNKLLVVSTLLSTNVTAKNLRPYKDGYLTGRNTFQKYFEQSEIHQFLEDSLNVVATPVGPGIFYIFKQPVLLQSFLSNRNRRSINWENISLRLFPNRQERKTLQNERMYSEKKSLIDSFWQRMIDLGRLPSDAEFENISEIRQFTTPQALRRFFIEKYGNETLIESYKIRRNDLIVFLALSNFRRKIPFLDMPKNLQLDIRAFFGSYANALKESLDALYMIGNPSIITEECNKTDFGLLDEQALYIHTTLIPELCPVLRIYVGCAELFYGDLEKVDIIKIHKESGKITLLLYDDFMDNPLPELHERIKVDLRNQKIFFFNHKSETNQQVLYFKERYVSTDHPNRSEWLRFSKKILALGVKPGIGFGPSKQEMTYLF